MKTCKDCQYFIETNYVFMCRCYPKINLTVPYSLACKEFKEKEKRRLN